MWYVYILLCTGNTFYTGISPDPQKRFLAHLSGKGAKYTKAHKPLKILYTEALESRPTAMKRELQIKSWNKKRKMTLINSMAYKYSEGCQNG